MEIFNTKDIQYLLDILENEFGELGFEFHPFKIDFYNACVEPIFRLPYSGDTIAILIISRPDMFEKTFLPFLKEHYAACRNDPIDQCMSFHFSKIKETFSELDVELIYDYELYPNRRPKILLQTAAHVSGAAYFYQRKYLISDLTGTRTGLGGVCIHPRYGGWFAMRSVAVFKNVQCPSLHQTNPIDIVSSQKDKLKLLELFNSGNGDWLFRDIIPVKQRYSNLQIKYFSTLPKDRRKLIEDWLNGE